MSRNMLFWWPPILLSASQSKRPKSASLTPLIVNTDLPWRPRTSKRPSWLWRQKQTRITFFCCYSPHMYILLLKYLIKKHKAKWHPGIHKGYVYLCRWVIWGKFLVQLCTCDWMTAPWSSLTSLAGNRHLSNRVRVNVINCRFITRSLHLYEDRWYQFEATGQLQQTRLSFQQSTFTRNEKKHPRSILVADTIQL